jgi:hypothetical protein
VAVEAQDGTVTLETVETLEQTLVQVEVEVEAHLEQLLISQELVELVAQE